MSIGTELQELHATERAGSQPLVDEGVAACRVVLLVQGPSGFRHVELAAGAGITLGRCPPADVQVPAPLLSRLHARFARDGDAVVVTDLDSLNGTWLRGERIHSARLAAGDHLSLGGLTVSVQIGVTAALARLGLIGFQALMGALRDECQRAQLLHRPVSVMALRISPGARLPLELLAEACVARLRPIDRLAIDPGQSLVVLLPEADGPAARRSASELQAALAARGRVVAGIATFPAAGAQPHQLVRAAQQALMQASAQDRLVVVPSAEAAAPLPAVRQSNSMLQLQRQVERIAPRPITVLITGETGSGKELVASQLHKFSPRHKGPLRSVNCATLPGQLLESALFGHAKGAFTGAEREHPGLFEQAQGGTVFLDEVAELSLHAQAALLRVLETHQICRVGGSRDIPVDVRVVAATHRDLAALCAQGAFRADLYHRLSAVVLRVPPLRERHEEILPLAEYFLEAAAQQWGAARCKLSQEASALLQRYAWPGNVRELRNVIERAAALCEGDVIQVHDLPDGVTAGQSSGAALVEPSSPSAEKTDVDLRAALQAVEAQLIRNALRTSQGNQRKAAALLRLPLRTLERKLRNLSLQPLQDT